MPLTLIGVGCLIVGFTIGRITTRKPDTLKALEQPKQLEPLQYYDVTDFVLSTLAESKRIEETYKKEHAVVAA